MSPIPTYWYIEADFPGLSFEPIPVPSVWPVPSGGLSDLIDRQTGEIHGQAILMCALPWPRFRDFSTGKQVILPCGMAEALERCEAIFGALDGEREPFTCGHKVSDRGYHLRVENSETKSFVTFHCNCTFPLERRHSR